MSKHHIAQNSFYVVIHRIRFGNSEYIKAWLKYYSKASDRFLTEERSVKVKRSIMKYWEFWNE